MIVGTVLYREDLPRDGRMKQSWHAISQYVSMIKHCHFQPNVARSNLAQETESKQEVLEILLDI